MPSPNPSDIVSAVESVMAECQRAIKLHPHWPSDPLHAVAILAEELGELTQKCLQATYEPNKGVTVADIHEEAVQVAAMGLRFLVNFERYTFPAVNKKPVAMCWAPLPGGLRCTLPERHEGKCNEA